MEKYSLERTFEKHREFHGRDDRSLVHDKIYRGMFESSLVKQGYSKKDLRQAVEAGWLKETYIDPDGMGIRKAYLWLLEEMPQRNWFKRQIDKVKRWFEGDYDRYYGLGDK